MEQHGAQGPSRGSEMGLETLWGGPRPPSWIFPDEFQPGNTLEVEVLGGDTAKGKKGGPFRVLLVAMRGEKWRISEFALQSAQALKLSPGTKLLLVVRNDTGKNKFWIDRAL